jgi:hypothetical protein
VTGIVVVAGVIMGLFLGWCVTMVITLALVSCSQERMQRKVRYWQAETARAQAEAGRLAGAAARRHGARCRPARTASRGSCELRR